MWTEGTRQKPGREPIVRLSHGWGVGFLQSEEKTTTENGGVFSKKKRTTGAAAKEAERPKLKPRNL